MYLDESDLLAYFDSIDPDTLIADADDIIQALVNWRARQQYPLSVLLREKNTEYFPERTVTYFGTDGDIGIIFMPSFTHYVQWLFAQDQVLTASHASEYHSDWQNAYEIYKEQQEQQRLARIAHEKAKQERIQAERVAAEVLATQKVQEEIQRRQEQRASRRQFTIDTVTLLIAIALFVCIAFVFSKGVTLFPVVIMTIALIGITGAVLQRRTLSKR